MSDTPRTDAVCFSVVCSDDKSTVVWSDFARELEREISALKSGEHLLFSQRLVPKLEAENASLRVLVKELEGKLAAEAEYAAETHARHQGLVEQVEHLIGIIQQLESDLARFGTIEAFEQKKEAQP